MTACDQAWAITAEFSLVILIKAPAISRRVLILSPEKATSRTRQEFDSVNMLHLRENWKTGHFTLYIAYTNSYSSGTILE